MPGTGLFVVGPAPAHGTQLQSPDDVTRKFVESCRVAVQTVALAVEPVVMGANGMTATPTFPLKTKLAATFR